MIRNVVLGRLGPTGDAELLDRALVAINALRTPGMLSMVAGRDLGLREGGWDMAITAEFVDEAAYRVYDLDEEHNRIRRELFGPSLAEVARVQFEVPDPA